MRIDLNTLLFDKALSSGDINVQKALESLDNSLLSNNNLSDVSDFQTSLDNLTQVSSGDIGQVLTIDATSGAIWKDKITTFLGLTDTPSEYTSQADSLLKVNTEENSLEFIGIEINAANIKMDGIASVGVLDSIVRADHIHPTDTSREPANANIQAHIELTSGNPHQVTKTEIGLPNVDNTSDVNKPVSTAQQTALDLKTNILDIVDNVTSTDVDKPLSANQGKILKDYLQNVNKASGVYLNALPNGDMLIAQDGTNFPNVSNNVYTLDGVKVVYSGSTIDTTVSQDTDVPSGEVFKKSLKIVINTAETSMDASDRYLLRMPIEGYDFANFIEEEATLSFWVASTKIGAYGIGLYNYANDRNYIKEYNVDATNTWEQKIVPLDFAGAVNAGSWNYENQLGIMLNFVLMAGSNYQNTPDTWLSTANMVTTSNQVNACDSNTNIFRLTGVQLNIGNTVIYFEHLDFGKKLFRNQRYFNKTFNYGVKPAQNVSSTTGCLIGDSSGTSIGSLTMIWNFKNTMRITNPTITTYNPYFAGSGVSKSGSLNFPVAVYTTGDKRVGIRNSDATISPGGTYLLHATADARF